MIKFYFKSYYSLCQYSQGWYGTLEYAPFADVIFYNDIECFCIGIIDVIIDGIEYITEEEAIDIINSYDNNLNGIWYGEKLANRWNEVVVDG